MATKSQGHVKFFNEVKGYGFIIDDSDGKEYFIHLTGLLEEARKESKVNFAIVDGKRGKLAINITQIK